MDHEPEPEKILAFCHIEKAAGTSLIHILRRIFSLRYASVRPMHSRDNYYFTSRDLKTVKRLNPFLRGIGGHSVVPRGDLVECARTLAFITQVRDPVARTASQYRFRVNRMKREANWQSYLKHPDSKNFQVHKLAGCADFDLAKENILKHFMLAGCVEEFDSFLVLLAQKLQLPLRLFTYSKKNVGAKQHRLNVPSCFYEQLQEQNQLDQQLYNWIRTEMLSAYISVYSGDFMSDLETFRNLQKTHSQRRITPCVDFIYRNAYMKPVSGLIRVSNGLPYLGSYSSG